MPTDNRRVFPRKRVSIRLEGRSNDGTVKVSTGGRVRLDVDDLSLGGLSAVVDQPLVRGSRIAVFFPPQSSCGGSLASGKVVRCDRGDKGYRVGVEFDRVPSVRGRMPYSEAALSSECA
jgi:hypothetical protein